MGYIQILKLFENLECQFLEILILGSLNYQKIYNQ